MRRNIASLSLVFTALIAVASSRRIQMQQSPDLLTMSLDGTDWIASNANGSILVAASVPGNIFTDLFSNNIIGEPYYRYGDADYSWVGYDSWTYKKNFYLPAGFAGPGRLVLLECDGLDTAAQLFLNGKNVGSANNMFRQYQFDITQFVSAANGSNSLVIQFQSAASYAKARAEAYPYELPTADSPAQHGAPFRNMIRKEQSSFSWDWGPMFLTQGVWKSIRIVSYSSARLQSTAATAVRTSGRMRWQINVFADVSAVATTDVSFTLTLDGIQLAVEKMSLLPGERTVSIVGNLFDPELWWPVGYGPARLYNLTVSFSTPTFSQTNTHMIGFREIEIIEAPIPGQEGATFGLRVNGIPIFSKGANFIPIDAFESRVTTETIENILQSAVDANMNIIRVWGGGIYQREEFYEIASRLGLMVWEEFMFACAMMPRDSAFLENVAEEVRYQVKRLMTYPAVAVWSGNNENEAALDWFQVTRDHRDRYVVDQVKLYVDTIRDTLLQVDSTRPFVFSSPSNGPLSYDPYVLRWGNAQSPLWGDVHYYNYLDDCTNLTLIPPARFMSEYGFQSFDSLPTLAPTLDPALGDVAYNSPLMNWRQHHDNGTNQIIYQAQLHFKYTPQNKTTDDFKRFIYVSQTMQTHCIRTWAEFLRRGRDMPQKTQGSIYWQLNQIWPAPSWASMEYSGRWKMLHYAAKHFYAPIIVSSFESSPGIITIYVTSDSLKPFSGSLGITIMPWSTSRNNPSTSSVPVKIDPLSFFAYKFQLPANVGRKSHFMLLQLFDGSQEIARNVQYLAKLKDSNLQVPQITASGFSQPSNNTIAFTLSTSSAAPYVWMESPYQGRFSDNGFLLLQSESVDVVFKAAKGETISVETFKSNLSVTSLAEIS